MSKYRYVIKHGKENIDKMYIIRYKKCNFCFGRGPCFCSINFVKNKASN